MEKTNFEHLKSIFTLEYNVSQETVAADDFITMTVGELIPDIIMRAKFEDEIRLIFGKNIGIKKSTLVGTLLAMIENSKKS